MKQQKKIPMLIKQHLQKIKLLQMKMKQAFYKITVNKKRKKEIKKILKKKS